MATYLDPEDLAFAQAERRKNVERWRLIQLRQRRALNRRIFNRSK